MQVDIAYRPTNSMARIALAGGESVVAESGAMVGMSPDVNIQTSSGGMLSGMKRLFGGESFFRNTFTAGPNGGELLVSGSLPGDMVKLEMSPTGYFIQSSSYIASSPNVAVETKVGGARTFFAGEGLFVLKATASAAGDVLVGAFGGIQELVCDGNLVIDTGHLVAWDASLDYSTGKSASGWIASFLSGEGLVCHFRGQGRIWIQTRNPQEYGTFIGRLLPPRQS